MLDGISYIFNTFLVFPLTNLFVAFTVLTGNAGLAVILVTIFIRFITLPLNIKQMKTTRAMAALAPQLQGLQKRFKDPKRRSQEQMRLYKEAKVSPAGCFSSLLVQMPILFALFQTFRTTVGETPESLISLSDRLYGWEYLRTSMPLPADFLWLNLGQPDQFVLPVTVAASTFVLQKVTMLPATDDKQRAQNSMMNFLMPLMFGYITLTLPSGLGLYYFLSNLIGIAMQYMYVGRGPVNWRALVGLSQDAVLPRAVIVRQEAVDKFSNLDDSEDEEGEEGDAKEDKPAGQSKAAKRRRRYTSGKRRGRR